MSFEKFNVTNHENLEVLQNVFAEIKAQKSSLNSEVFTNKLQKEKQVNKDKPVIKSRESWDAVPMKKDADVLKYTDAAPDSDEYKEALKESLNGIVVHHSALGGKPGPKKIQQMHLSRGFDDIGYHYVIGKDGSIYSGRPLHLMGAHAGIALEANQIVSDANEEFDKIKTQYELELKNKTITPLEFEKKIDIAEKSRQEIITKARIMDPDFGKIGIVLDGNFNRDPLEILDKDGLKKRYPKIKEHKDRVVKYEIEKESYLKQMEALTQLLNWIKTEYHIPNKQIISHREVAKKVTEAQGLTPETTTVCPGRSGHKHIQKNIIPNLEADRPQSFNKLPSSSNE